MYKQIEIKFDRAEEYGIFLVEDPSIVGSKIKIQISHGLILEGTIIKIYNLNIPLTK